MSSSRGGSATPELTRKKNMIPKAVADAGGHAWNAALDVARGHDHDRDLAEFATVLRAEHEHLRLRRWRMKNPAIGPEDPSAFDATKDNTALGIVSGIALSGGGIRSATFSLGVLQEMSRLNLLGRFDYLSTVSGGGYVGGWWSAWLSRKRAKGTEAKSHVDLFPADEQLEPARWHEYATGTIPDGSLSAQKEDPIHHLRLFGNYLTPRKGLLSLDTWKAATIIGRNILLTWAVIIPVLATAVLVGQWFFAVQPDAASHFYNVDRTVDAHLAERLWLMAKPLLVLASWLAALTIVWMLNSVGYWFPSLLGIAAVALMGRYVASAFGVSAQNDTFWRSNWTYAALIGIAFIVARLAVPLLREGLLARPSLREVRRNRAVRWQAWLSVAFALLVVVLGIAGFAGDVSWFFLTPQPGHPIFDYFKKAGGAAAAMLALGSGVFTAVKSAPSTSTDPKASAPQSLVSRITFLLAPPLTLLLFGIIVSASTHSLLASATPASREQLVSATWLGVLVLLGFAAYETVRDETHLARWRRAMIVLVPLVVALIALWRLPPAKPVDRALAFAALAVAGIAVVGRLTTVTIGGQLVPRLKLLQSLASRGWLILAGVTVVVGGATWIFTPSATISHTPWPLVALFGCAAFVIAESIWLKEQRWRAAGLVSIAVVGLACLVAPDLAGAAPLTNSPPPIPYGTLTFSLAVVALSMVVGFGWLADPNQLSLHAFYRSRLVRAYMGASNTERDGLDIGESHEKDDLRLTDLRNCEHGGPYHLINTTLNLVGGRDLGTAQRSADNFLMSREYCGSSRTGYRPTSSYMKGLLGLGTAVATSGAAVSPTMGSKTPTAALTMLLTFFNVRLGFWAPTPNQGRWRSTQARLWPFYTLRESLSQTNDLSTYCYLTDGGHFDNTGLHALVARGCRVIILSDCGADPLPSFEDVGTAVRRCRIDFGTEITFDLSTVTPKDRRSSAHTEFGTILYSERHAEALGWGKTSEDQRTGVIVWIKPGLTGTETVDVAQYGLEHQSFPQQPTLNQWYDEAQFESYRKLGVLSAREAFETSVFSDKAAALIP